MLSFFSVCLKPLSLLVTVWWRWVCMHVQVWDDSEGVKVRGWMLTWLGADNGMTLWPLPGVRYLWHASLLAAMSSCPLSPSAFTLSNVLNVLEWCEGFDLTNFLTLGLIISTTPWKGCECGWSSHQNPNVLFYSVDILHNVPPFVWITSVFLAHKGSSWSAFIQLDCTIISLGVKEARPSETEYYPLSSALFPSSFCNSKMLIPENHLKYISWDL